MSKYHKKKISKLRKKRKRLRRKLERQYYRERKRGRLILMAILLALIIAPYVYAKNEQTTTKSQEDPGTAEESNGNPEILFYETGRRGQNIPQKITTFITAENKKPKGKTVPQNANASPRASEGQIECKGSIEEIIKCSAKKYGVEEKLLYCLAKAESGLRADATNSKGNSKGVDRGLYQFNSHYKGYVSKECALDPACAAGQAAKEIKKGKIRHWYGIKNKAFKKCYGRNL